MLEKMIFGTKKSLNAISNISFRTECFWHKNVSGVLVKYGSWWVRDLENMVDVAKFTHILSQ